MLVINRLKMVILEENIKNDQLFNQFHAQYDDSGGNGGHIDNNFEDYFFWNK